MGAGEAVLKLPVNDERLSIIFCVVSDSILERDMIEKSLDGLDTLQKKISYASVITSS